MSRLPIIVVKVGGSLFDLADLPQRLDRWIARRPAGRYIWIAGGGALADAVRAADARFQLDEVKCHWWCVELLEISAQLLAELLPRASLTTSFAELKGAIDGRDGHAGRDHASHTIFAVEQFLREVEPSLAGSRLPHSWSVTTDSIAARLAEVLGAEELVLLKSTSPPAGATRETAVQAGYIDPYFVRASRELTTVCCVNLRSEDFRETLLGESHALSSKRPIADPHE